METITKDSDYYVSDAMGNVSRAHGPVNAPAGHVLIRTEFAGVNRGDVLELQGAYGQPPAAGTRVGQDIVGIVEAATSPEGAHLVGQRVFGQITGAWGQYATADPTCLALTGGLAPEEAVTLPLAGFTALRLARQAVQHAGDLREKNVLITGGTGAVGGLLIGMLLKRGAQVWVLSRRTQTDMPAGVRVVRSLSEVPEVAVAFESVGGELLGSALSRLERHGHLWWFGEASRQPGTLDFFNYLGHSPVHIHHFAHWIHDGDDATDLAELRDMVRSGTLTTPRARQVSPEELPSAIQDIAHDSIHEKVIVHF